MASAFALNIFQQPPRETSGGRSSNRHDFHHSWAVCLAIDLLRAEKDFLLVLEFHDDVVVFEPSSQPSAADFFQLKTKREGNWTLTELYKPSQSGNKASSSGGASPPTPSSILGKLVDHWVRWPDNARTLNLVSNARFKCDLTTLPPSGERASFVLSELVSTHHAGVCAALRKELSLSEEPPLDRIVVTVAPIHLDSHVAYGVGKLTSFLEERYPDRRFRTQTLFLSIGNEMARRGCSEARPGDYGELQAKYGVTSALLLRWIEQAVADDPQILLNDFVHQIQLEGAAFHEVLAIRDGWRRCLLWSTNPNDVEIHRLRDRIRVILPAVNAPGKTIELVRATWTHYCFLHGPLELPVDESLLKGTVAYEFAIQSRAGTPGPSQEADQKPEAKES